MIVVGGRFLSAEHIQHIHIDPISEQLCTVTVQMTGDTVTFGIGKSEVMDIDMAFELQWRIIHAIARYKSSATPEIQHVDFPKYEEVHGKEDSETQ